MTSAQIIAMPCVVDTRQWLELAAVQHPFLLVGTATIEHVETDTPVLGNLFVHPDLRRLGIATQLTRRAKAWADEHEQELYLHVRPDNTGAIALYEAEGFAPTGELTPEGSQWMMRLPLVLKPECWAEVLAGKLKGHVVRVARQDTEQPGFWWCVWQERGKQKEGPFSASQLKAIGKEVARA